MKSNTRPDWRFILCSYLNEVSNSKRHIRDIFQDKGPICSLMSSPPHFTVFYTTTWEWGGGVMNNPPFLRLTRRSRAWGKRVVHKYTVRTSTGAVVEGNWTRAGDLSGMLVFFMNKHNKFGINSVTFKNNFCSEHAHSPTLTDFLPFEQRWTLAASGGWAPGWR